MKYQTWTKALAVRTLSTHRGAGFYQPLPPKPTSLKFSHSGPAVTKTPFEKTLADALSIGQEVIAVCGNITCRFVVEIDLNRIVRHVGLDHPLLPRRGERHYSERLRCPECDHRGAYIWLGEATKLTPAEEELVHRVERWSEDENHILEVMGRVRNLLVARAAYAEAVRIYPEALITLRQGAHTIEESPRLAARTADREKVRQLRPVVPDTAHYGGKRRRKFR